MKKFLSIAVRILLAAAGIGYIIWTLSWSDQVLVPEGYQFADGRLVDEEMLVEVVSEAPGGRYEVRRPDDGVTLAVTVSPDGLDAREPQARPGIVTLLRRAHWKQLLLGLAILSALFPIQTLRWWLLMRCRGMHVPIARAFRLTMVGLFFNFCMPGMTGGDVVKAYYAAKGSGSRGVAVMSVVFDRAVGLMGLVLLAGLAGLVLLLRGGLEPRLHTLVLTLTGVIWAGFLVVIIGVNLYFSRRLRRVLGWQALIGRLGPDHLLVRVDEAAAAYRDHKALIFATILLSLPVHISQAMATTLAGWALGMGLGAWLMLAVLPVLFLAGSVPLTYQGLGVMEALAVELLLPSPDANANQIVSMLVMIRLFLIVYALVGAVLMLGGDIHLHPQVDGANDEADPADDAPPVSGADPAT